MEQDFVTIDLRTVWNLARKNMALIVILFVIGGLGAYYISAYVADPQYEASVTLVVNTREEQSITITGDQINSARQLVNTYAVILTNDTLLNDIIIQLNLDDTIATLGKRITAEAVNQTQVMRMTMRDNNPQTAKAVLDIIMAQAEELLTNSVKAGSVEIVSPPRINYTPVSPNIVMFTIIGAAAGLLLSMIIIFARRAMKNTFISDEDVTEQLGLPILGVIPSVSVRGQKYGR